MNNIEKIIDNMSESEKNRFELEENVHTLFVCIDNLKELGVRDIGNLEHEVETLFRKCAEGDD